MTILIFIGILLFLISAFSRKKKRVNYKTSYNAHLNKSKNKNVMNDYDKFSHIKFSYESNFPKVDPKEKVNQFKENENRINLDIKNRTLNNKPVSNKIVSGSNLQDLKPKEEKAKDNSIIDISGEAYLIKNATDKTKDSIFYNNNLNSINSLKKYDLGVPFWPHHYVYSYSEINGATNEQKIFYSYFRDNFLRGEYYDLEGNTNYAFILLFDLLIQFESHKNILKLEKQLKDLGEKYPKTRSYGNSFLIKKMESIGDVGGVQRLKSVENISFQNKSIDYPTFEWRTKYKKKLSLNKDEEELIDKLWSSNNSFINIEFCCIEILKLYISTIAELKYLFFQKDTTLEKEFSSVADIIAQKHFKYNQGTSNYIRCVDSTIVELYSNVFKYCENAVREYYNYKRKINIDTKFTIPEVKSIYETKITSNVNEVLPILILSIRKPDEITDIELYRQNPSRWKVKLDELINAYNNNSNQLINSVIKLSELNSKNTSMKVIFFEASKKMIKNNKEAALTLYAHYLFHDLNSSSFDNRQFTQTELKNLFKSNEQQQDFENMVIELTKDKDLKKALNTIPKIYAIKRKKIHLDKASITKVQQQLSGTVELLNEYLKDDYENEDAIIKTQEINSEKDKIALNSKVEIIKDSIFLSDFGFTPLQIDTLMLFSKNKYSILQRDFESFARSKNTFKNPLIESINEICYNVLDDVLIEEEEGIYRINEIYYQRLLTK